MSKRPCWSWRYRLRFSEIHDDRQFWRMYSFLSENFGLEDQSQRWAVTFVQRRKNAHSWWPAYNYSRVCVHFKHQEDLVLFKLQYEFSI